MWLFQANVIVVCLLGNSYIVAACFVSAKLSCICVSGFLQFKEVLYYSSMSCGLASSVSNVIMYCVFVLSRELSHTLQGVQAGYPLIIRIAKSCR